MKRFLYTFIGVFLLGILANMLHLAYFFEGMDVYIKNLSAGLFTGGVPANMPHTFESHVGLSYIYQFLYTHLPSIPWYDLAMTTFAAISVSLGWILLRHFEPEMPLWKQLIYIILFIRLLTLIQLTLVGFMMAFFSLMALSRLSLRSNWERAALLTLFLISGMIRMDSILLGLAVFVVFELLTKARLQWRILLPAVTLLGLLMVVVHVPMSEEASYFKKIRPYQYALWDFSSNISELDGDDKDCLLAIEELTSASFLSDNHYLTPEYFERIGLVKKDKLNVAQLANFFTSTHMKPKAGELGNFLRLNLFLSLSVLIALLFMMVFYRRNATYLTGMLCLFFAVALILKMEHHILMIFFYVFLFEVLRVSDSSRKLTRFVLAVIMILGTIQLASDTATCRKLSGFYTANIPTDTQLLCVDVTLMDKINSRVMSGVHYPDIVGFDNGIVYLTNELDQLHGRIGIDKSYSGLMEHLRLSGELIYTAQHWRMELHNNYYHSCYDQPEFDIEQVSAINDGPYYLFSLRIE